MDLPTHVDINELAFAFEDSARVAVDIEAERPFYTPSFVAAWKNDIRKKCEQVEAALIKLGPTSDVWSLPDTDEWVSMPSATLDVHAAPSKLEISDRLVASINRANAGTCHRALSSILCMKTQAAELV